MKAALLLDTCAVLWAANATEAPLLRDHLREAGEQGLAVCISPITAWEIATLVAEGKIGLARPVLGWFEEMLARSGAELVEVSPRILVAASALPPDAPRDTADRILLATARENGLRLVTRDRRILDYAAKGHVMALAC